MTVEIFWQIEVNGTPIRQKFKLLGESFTLIRVGDVIVDTNWMTLADDSTENPPNWIRELEKALLFPTDEPFQIKLLAQGTSYYRKVWKALTEIPAGEVKTYSEIAWQLKSGPRAVAQACRNNPYPGIIPCHRVVSKTGIGGFMGQSLGEWIDFKSRLLNYEHNIRDDQR